MKVDDDPSPPPHADQSDVRGPVEAKPWMAYAGIVASGDPRSSQNIDDVVYLERT